MGSKLVFSSVPFSTSDIPLGSLVPDPRYPNQDALSVLTVEDTEISVRPQKDFRGFLKSDATLSFQAQITRLLLLSRDKADTGTLDLSAKEGKIYELKAPKILFHKLCKEERVRTWLREGIEDNQDAYFVTAVRTFVDATVNKGAQLEKAIELKGGLPVGEIVTNTMGIPVGDSVDVSTSFRNTQKKSGEDSYRMEGEYIFAIGYRKVILKKLEGDEAKLGRDNIWRLWSDTRVGVSTNVESEHEVFEIDIEDTDTDGRAFIGSVGDGNSHTSIVSLDGEEYFLPTITSSYV